MRYQTIIFFLLELLVVVFTVNTSLSHEGSSASKVTILLSSRNKIYIKIEEGIRESLTGNIVDIFLEDSKRKALKSIRKFKPDVVIAIGDDAALWAKKKLPTSLVVASGIAYQNDPSAFENTVGVALDFELDKYLSLIDEAFPHVTSIGFLYNPFRNTQLVEGSEAASQGLRFQINSRPIENVKEVRKAIESLRKGGIEVFLVTNDPLLLNSDTWNYLVGFSITNQIALVVPSRSLLKSGGMISYEADLLDIGRQTGELVDKIIQDPKIYGDLDLEFPRLSLVGINKKISRVLDVEIPKAIIKKADYILDD